MTIDEFLELNVKELVWATAEAIKARGLPLPRQAPSYEDMMRLLVTPSPAPAKAQPQTGQPDE